MLFSFGMSQERFRRLVLEAAETMIHDAARDAVRFQRRFQRKALAAHVAYVFFVRMHFDAVLRTHAFRSTKVAAVSVGRRAEQSVNNNKTSRARTYVRTPKPLTCFSSLAVLNDFVGCPKRKLYLQPEIGQ